MYTVTRQIQWPDGAKVVEVSAGGLDLANPDMLEPKYPQEGESFHSPVEAAMAAITICRAWRKDGHKDARVGYGATLGMTMPFSPCTFQELRDWAVDRYEQLIAELPECNSCGDTIWDLTQAVRLSIEGAYGEVYCSQKCAEDAYEALVDPDDE